MSLKQIAEIAGVSISTASRVINSQNPKCASQEVQNRIWAAVRSLGYTPNPVAQDLKKAHAEKASPLLQSSISYCCSELFFHDNYRDWELLSLLENEILSHHFIVEMARSGKPPQNPDVKCAGLILIGKETDQRLGQYLQRFKNVLNIVFQSGKYPCDVIFLSMEKNLRHCWTYLCELGHSHIFFAGAGQGDFFDSYTALFQGTGFPVKFIPCGLSVGDGILLIDELLECPTLPSALVCETNAIACGVMQAARSRGLSVPGNLSVVSLGSRLPFSPSGAADRVTTFSYNKSQISHLAVDLLIDRIQRGHLSNVICEPRCQMEDNGTCAPIERSV